MSQRETVYRIGRSRLRVLYGSVVNQKADVLVSSDDNHLTAGGGVSMALANAGGDEIRNHARKLIPLKQGDVAVTTAGQLPARYLFHAVTLDFQTRMEPDGRCIEKLTARALELCDALQLRTIAFPPLGTGAARVPFAEAADAMTRTIADYLAGKTDIDEVAIVLFARPGIAQEELDVFYEKTVGLAATAGQTRRFAESLQRLTQLVESSPDSELRAALQESLSELGPVERELRSQPSSMEEIDAVQSNTRIRTVGERTVERIAEATAAGPGDGHIEAVALRTRLEGLGMLLNVHYGSLNKLEIQAAKHGSMSVPLGLQNQIDDITQQIAACEQNVREMRVRIAELED